MIQILSSPIFQYLILPLLTTLLTIILKIASKNDSLLLFKREDFAVGIDLSATSLLILMSKCAIVAGILNQNNVDRDVVSNGSELLLEMIIIFIGMFIGLFALTIIVRRIGWHKEQQRLKIFWGIILPDIIGVIYLIIVYSKSIAI